VGLTVTFRWRLGDPEPGESYRYEVRLDKGTDACDSGIEEAIAAETRTCLVADLRPAVYTDTSVDFAVRATNSQGRTFCTRGQRLFLNPNTSASPPC
jgi:RNase P/RNase MRP subunit p29